MSTTVVQYANIYAAQSALPLFVTILLCCLAVALLSFGTILVINDDEWHFT